MERADPENDWEGLPEIDWPEGDRPARRLYIHIPFCLRKCPYCAFYSLPGTAADQERFAAALRRELRRIAPRLAHPLDSVFVGGGTPTLLPIRLLAGLLEELQRLELTPAKEFSIECNPATIDREKAQTLKALGVNRVSIGAQSFDEAVLRALGRPHGVREILATCEAFRAAGFEEINLDLIFGAPGQDLSIWKRTLERTFELNPTHLSCYELTFEKGAPFFEARRSGRIAPDEDLAAAMYDLLLERAEQAGLRRYEVSNFAAGPEIEPDVPKHACRHNIAYWRGEAYWGAGPAAHSFVKGVRFMNRADREAYCAALETDRPPPREIDLILPARRAAELAGVGLRMTAGWPYALFRQRTGRDLRREWGPLLEDLEREGLGKDTGRAFRPTPLGLRFADAAAARFLEITPEETAPESATRKLDEGSRERGR